MEPRSQNVIFNGCQAETVVGLPWAADSCPWVGKLRTVGFTNLMFTTNLALVSLKTLEFPT